MFECHYVILIIRNSSCFGKLSDTSLGWTLDINKAIFLCLHVQETLSSILIHQTSLEILRVLTTRLTK